MSKRYVVIKVTDVARNLEYYSVYQKNWLLADTYIETFLDEQKAIALTLRLIQYGGKVKKELVFDTNKNLSLDIHM